MSGRVVFAITEAQAGALLILAAGGQLSGDQRRVACALKHRALVEHDDTAGRWAGWRLSAVGAAAVTLLQAEAARRAKARLAWLAGKPAEQGRAAPCPPAST